MKTVIAGPYSVLGKQAEAVRNRSHKAAELRMIQKEAHALADRAFALDIGSLGKDLMRAAEFARQLATLTENV